MGLFAAMLRPIQEGILELKEFIKQSISAIVDATSDLQDKYSDMGILVNPPSAQSGNEVYQPGSSNYTMRRVKNVAFDVAVTAESGNKAEGGAGIQVFAVKIGAKGEITNASASVSRVSFEIPIALRPTNDEATNTQRRDNKIREIEAANHEREPYDPLR